MMLALHKTINNDHIHLNECDCWSSLYKLILFSKGKTLGTSCHPPLLVFATCILKFLKKKKKLNDSPLLSATIDSEEGKFSEP